MWKRERRRRTESIFIHSMFTCSTDWTWNGFGSCARSMHDCLTFVIFYCFYFVKWHNSVCSTEFDTDIFGLLVFLVSIRIYRISIYFSMTNLCAARRSRWQMARPVDIYLRSNALVAGRLSFRLYSFRTELHTRAKIACAHSNWNRWPTQKQTDRMHKPNNT